MTEPKWAEAVRARTERLIQDMHLVLPQNAGPVELEAALISLEQGYFGDFSTGHLRFKDVPEGFELSLSV